MSLENPMRNISANDQKAQTRWREARKRTGEDFG